MTELCLHLGAHKTATTWLQTRLEAGQAALREAGIGYAPLDVFRADFTVPFTDYFWHRIPAHRDAAQARMRAWLDAAPSRFIASDENLIGDCDEIVRTGQCYPDLAPKLAALAETLPRPPARVVLVVRSYATFFASVYGESLRNGPFRAFDPIRHRFLQEDGQWLRVTGALVRAFGEDAVRVIRFEQVTARFPALLETLCGQPLDPARLPDSADRREGMSAAAVDALGRIAELSDPTVALLAVPAVERRFPRGADRPGFAPWTAEERKRLDGRYERHLAVIAARWPRVLV